MRSTQNLPTKNVFSHPCVGRMKQLSAYQREKGKFQLQVLKELFVLEEVPTGHMQGRGTSTIPERF